MSLPLLDVTDEISRTHGDTRIALLRQVYGAAFGTGVDGRKSLRETIDTLDSASLEALVRDYRSGWLFGPVTAASE